MPGETLKNSLPKVGQNLKTTKSQESPRRKLGKSLQHGIEPNIAIDYGIITDAYGPEETVEIWHNEIGKPPTLST